MKLELRSIQNDLLELEIEDIRPRIDICEIFIDGRYYPWNAVWENIKIEQFLEDKEVVKNKIISFYKAETASARDSQGIVKRVPGTARLITDDECWELKNCKVVNTALDKEVCLELAFDGATYKNKKTS